MRCKNQFSTPPHLRKIVGLEESPLAYKLPSHTRKKTRATQASFLKMKHRWTDTADGGRDGQKLDGRIRPSDPFGGFAGVHPEDLQGYIRGTFGYIRRICRGTFGYIRVHSGTFGPEWPCRSPRKHKGFAMSWGTFAATAHPFYILNREKCCECVQGPTLPLGVV